MRLLSKFVKWLMKMTPFELQRRRDVLLPDVTLDPLSIVMACLRASHKQLTIVQIGACDGTTLDPIRDTIKQPPCARF